MADSAQSPAYPATPGYDLATGLGSPNVAALIDAPQWSTGSLLTSVTLEPSTSTITLEESVQLVATVTVQSQGASEVRGGKVTFYSAGRPLGIVPLDCRAGKAATLRVPGAAFGPAGDYTGVYAVYSGGAQECGRDSAIYFGSHSSPVTVDVEQAKPGHSRF